jgi:glycine oxidase
MKHHPTRRDNPRVAIIGAGVIGLAVGWRLARRGAQVTIFDRSAAGGGASHAAAGMLAATMEAEPGEEALVELGRASHARWAAFAAELLDATGIDVELRTEGTLIVAVTADDRAQLMHHLALQQKLELAVEWLTASEVRRREPHLATTIAGAVLCAQDHQVDNRRVVAALLEAARLSGVTMHEHRAVAEIVTAAGTVTGIALEDGQQIPADVVVLAAGAWSRGIGGLAADCRPPVRPVKGQMLALRMDPSAPLINHVICAPGVYLVPRRDGRLLVGATVEERGFDGSLTAGAVLTLLESAWRVVPSIEDLPIHEMWTGHRPGSRDDAPILGAGPMQGLIYATGHHRNGILLTPITADLIAGLILDGVADPGLAPFGIERFAIARAAE